MAHLTFYICYKLQSIVFIFALNGQLFLKGNSKYEKNVFYIYPHISHFWYSSFFVQINFFIWHFLFAWKISIDISYIHLLVLNSFSFCKPTKIFISVLMLKPSFGKKCKCIIYMLKHRYVWLSVKFHFCHRNIPMSINLKIKLLPSL